jgi:hypothetical protein
VSLFSSKPVDQILFHVDAPAGVIAKLSFMATSPGVCDHLIVRDGPSSWLVWIKACPGNPIEGEQEVGQLFFYTAPAGSGFAPMRFRNLTISSPEGIPIANAVARDGLAVLLQGKPLIAITRDTPGVGSIHVFGAPGVNYLLEARTGGLGHAGSWQYYDEILMQGTRHTFQNVPMSEPGRAFRIQIDPDWIP